eukprot:4914762-Amphidinium_carterae.1
MRADTELGERVVEAERRLLRATEVKAAEERQEEGLRTTGGVKAAGKRKAEAETDAVMSDVREIDDAEALKVWSELSELDPKVKGDTYLTEDGSQWNFSNLVDDLRVVKERRERAEAAGVS